MKLGWVTKKRYESEMKDLDDSIQRISAELRCLRGSHEWGIGRAYTGDLQIQCSHCYKPMPEAKS